MDLRGSFSVVVRRKLNETNILLSEGKKRRENMSGTTTRKVISIHINGIFEDDILNQF